MNDQPTGPFKQASLKRSNSLYDYNSMNDSKKLPIMPPFAPPLLDDNIVYKGPECQIMTDNDEKNPQKRA